MIATLRQAGILGPLDEHLARVLGRLVPNTPDEVLGAAALASHLAGAGHVCLALADHAGRAVRDAAGAPLAGLRWPALGAWIAALGASELVAVGGDPAPRPLVLDARGRLYLQRLWRHEQDLAVRLRERLGAPPPRLDAALLRDGMARLFGPPLGGAPTPGDGQRLAAALALTRRLCVITGGPGTGKTATVVRILALLVEQARAAGRPPELTLLAPTGKAAARLTASIQEARPGLGCDPAVRAAIPDAAMTIHRCLGPRRTAGGRLGHDADNPLPTDLVLVDEASMVDLALMSGLVAAVPPAARLILLGDREQLASVAPGSVLADLCNDGETPGYSRAFRQALAELTGDRLPEPVAGPVSELPGAGIRDSIAHLTHSFRFGAGSGIGRLARAISAGDAEAALAVLEDGDAPDVRWVPNPEGAGGAALVEAAVSGYTPFARATGATEAVAALGRFRVLCAHRTGPAGVEAANLAIAQGLRRAGLLAPEGRWYAGRPILIAQNSYPLGLFNGDVGVVLPTARGLRAVFVDPDGRTRSFAPARLPDHETAFAMTVHKSQGSELDDVILLLPDPPSRVVTRELLYTAVSRARRSVTLHATPEVLREAISRRVTRASGLRDLLWAD